MVGFEEKLVRGHVLKERLEMVEKAIHVQNAAGFCVKAELEPGERFKQLFERSDSSGEGDKTIAQIDHELLTLVHGADDTQVRDSGVPEFSVHQRFWDHSDDLSSGA